MDGGKSEFAAEKLRGSLIWRRFCPVIRSWIEKVPKKRADGRDEKGWGQVDDYRKDRIPRFSNH
jgi:hypothetical protein